MITEEGIVLKERTVGEQDKFIDILTKTRGVLELCVKGARKMTGKSGSSTQLFAYSRFCIDKRGERLYLNSAEPIHIFYGLRDSLTKVSLASYFAEVVRYCIKPERQNDDIMRLMLNTMHYLENGKRQELLLKAIFELRLMADTGFMPDILACKTCGTFEPEELFFSVSDGSFHCADCFTPDEGDNYIKMKLPVLRAVRHIVLAGYDRLYNFRVSEDTMQKLAYTAENYITAHLERSFRTLDFYRSLI
ncbi:MAG TPA: DNA repair protein RecO [Ruminococcus sp.]|nr:DNA repair protein RecO [Ruminococcus sp.]